MSITRATEVTVEVNPERTTALIYWYIPCIRVFVGPTQGEILANLVLRTRADTVLPVEW